MKLSFRNWISSSNFAHSAAAKPRPSAENFGIKESLSPLSQPLFTTTSPIVWKGVSSTLLCFICTIISYPYFAERYHHTTPTLSSEPNENMCFVVNHIKVKFLSQCNKSKVDCFRKRIKIWKNHNMKVIMLGVIKNQSLHPFFMTMLEQTGEK